MKVLFILIFSIYSFSTLVSIHTVTSLHSLHFMMNTHYVRAHQEGAVLDGTEVAHRVHLVSRVPIRKCVCAHLSPVERKDF